MASMRQINTLLGISMPWGVAIGILANLERDNPGGYALSLEIGFAKALGKRILLVDGKSSQDPDTARRLAMVRQCAEVHFATIHDAIVFLRQEETLS
jgi:hypothetical protein